MRKIGLPRIYRDLRSNIDLKSAYHDSYYAWLSRPRKLPSEFILLTQDNIRCYAFSVTDIASLETNKPHVRSYFSVERN
jgi:hypothetical protein